MIQVALVGYTNAGKSTLLNRLTGAGVMEEDRLFATLDPTSRFWICPRGEGAVDGYCRLHPQSSAPSGGRLSFHVGASGEADLLLHVVDASHPEAMEQMKSVERVLEDLGAGEVPVLTVFNKADREGGAILSAEGETIRISAYDADDRERLKEKIDRVLNAAQIHGSAEIPVSRGDDFPALPGGGDRPFRGDRSDAESGVPVAAPSL